MRAKRCNPSAVLRGGRWTVRTLLLLCSAAAVVIASCAAASSSAPDASSARDSGSVPPAAAATSTASPAAAGEGGPASSEYPLLGSARGGHLWSGYCAKQPDDSPLPVDPRSLIRPGVNAGKAAFYNAYWVDCHQRSTGDDAAPKTCGQYRERLARGRDLMENGKVSFFGGGHTDSLLSFSAQQYAEQWRSWGLGSRPANFDQLVAERWGMPIGEKRNPYPLPGEDPEQTDGGSGQLPLALTQLREQDGRYTGRLALNCHFCHSGKVGEPADGPGLGVLYGNGNSLVDIGAHFGDAFPGSPVAANKVRGSGDILIYPAIAAFDADRLTRYDPVSLLVAPSGGSVDFPVWWNVGHRTRRFHDGSFAMDDARPVMGFFMPIASATHLMDIEYGRRWIEQHDQDVQLWLEALTAPAYPGPVDKTLAETGAVLFHTRDLWADAKLNPVPRPQGGNGSCAGCHGVYSPRYVHDERFLDRPELEGIAARVVPIDVIGTDPARFESLDEGLKQNLQWTWWAYGTLQTPGACFGASEPGGYLAPPLYGVWATAPYFHNGSVPNVWEVLAPPERKLIWRRVLAPAAAAAPDAFMGFDTDLARAYDHEKLGWKYDALECGDELLRPALACSKQAAESSPASILWFTWNLDLPRFGVADLSERTIYNTNKYSQGNQGHEFTRVLSDAERRALVEYLKTL